MTSYEFDHSGVTYPDVTLDDLRLLLEEQAQDIITHPWDELRVMLGKHASIRIEVKLHGSVIEADRARSTYLLVRVDTGDVVDEIEITSPLLQTPEQGRALIERGA